MINEIEFTQLLENPESSILDFKTAMYDLKNDNDFENHSKMIKDILCFCNTIRSTTSYIIIGVSDDGKLVGIDKPYDDAIIQDKIKDKVNPKPFFLFQTIRKDGKTFGVFEFPIKKYHLPITTVVKLKGIETGEVYIRRGTMNTKATSFEAISVSKWLDSLPNSEPVMNSVSKELSTLLLKFTDDNNKLSVLLAEALFISKNYKLDEFTNFCSQELQGYVKSRDTDYESIKHRVQRVIVSINQIKLNPYSFQPITESTIRNELKLMEKKFHEVNTLISNPIIEIEQTLNAYLTGKGAYATTERYASELLTEWNKDSKIKVYTYYFQSNYENLYRNIRQRAIEIILKISTAV